MDELSHRFYVKVVVFSLFILIAGCGRSGLISATSEITPAHPKLTNTASPHQNNSPTEQTRNALKVNDSEDLFPSGLDRVVSNNDWTAVIEEISGIDMALVPPGCFKMGSSDEQLTDAMRKCEELRGEGNCQRSWYQNEQPAAEVCFDEPFWIDVYEVTNAQYGSPGKWEGDDLPREQVNWFEAAQHCEDRGARLPTEAEWEYAARGPDGLIFPWGDSFNRELVNSCDSSCEFNLIGTLLDDDFPYTAPVGSFPNGASWVGAVDMSGNVWEWTNSIYMDYPYNIADGREVDGTIDNDSRRVKRGGAWFITGSDLLRSAARYNVDPFFSAYHLGFRCVTP